MTSAHCESATSMFNNMLNAAMNGAKTTSREGNTREIINGAYSMPCDIHKNLCLSARRKVSATYAAAEMLWYFSLTGNIEMISEYAPQYPRWADSGYMLGAVGDRLNSRFSNLDALSDAATLLKQKSDTRQCVIAMWDRSDLQLAITGKAKNVPCYISFQVLVRQGTLHWITTMRSNDVWLGVPYDTFAFSTFQYALAAELCLDPGIYFHNVASMHVYEKHFKQANEAIAEARKPVDTSDFVGYGMAPTRCSRVDTLNTWKEAVRAEVALRASAKNGDAEKFNHVLNDFTNKYAGGMPADCVLCCAMFLARKYDMPFNNPCNIHATSLRIALKKEMEQ